MKRISLSFVALLVATPAAAETVSDAVLQCFKVEQALERIECYDRIAQRIDSGALSDMAELPDAPPVSKNSRQSSNQTVTASRAANKAEAEFGLSERERNKNQPDRLEARVSSKKEGPRGKWVITLDNGQVWKQQDADTFLFPDDGRIYIEKGFMGAFYLSSFDSNRRIRVKRQK